MTSREVLASGGDLDAFFELRAGARGAMNRRGGAARINDPEGPRLPFAQSSTSEQWAFHLPSPVCREF